MKPKGFTLVEVLVSLAILAVGLLSVAALIGSTIRLGARSRFENMANVLASEKLDSLNQWPSSELNGAVVADPNIACPGTCGALAGPAVCAAGDQYCDMVTVNEAGGADYETQTTVVNGVDQTTTIVHTNTGCVDTPANCGVANPPGGGSTFTRRWLITWDPTITGAGGNTAANGVRRITVSVTLNDASFKPPVTFQMSMVRP
jgi:type IV pilus modification protein PilV